MKKIFTKIISLETPSHLLLNGLLLSAKRSRTLFIMVHGLSSSLFSRRQLVDRLASSGADVLVFNNRGFGIINTFSRINPKDPEQVDKLVIGQAHEVFSDCLDDLDGAVRFGAQRGYKKIILVGHSTGCNKISYYLSRKSPALVKGAVLLGAVSDYAEAKKNVPARQLARALNYSYRLVKAGRDHELLPSHIWPRAMDAQRFISLNTPDSEEEIFTYASPDKKPVTLRKIKPPILVVLAEQDEFGDRPMIEIAQWFEQALKDKAALVKVIKGAPHSFAGKNNQVAKIMLDWFNQFVK